MQALQMLPDEGLDVTFRLDSVLDPVASLSYEDGKELYPKLPKEHFQGRPVFKEVVWVKIQIPGNRDEIIDTVATINESGASIHQNAHNVRFPHAWARFKASNSEGVTGFPLKEWSQATRSQVEMLAYDGVRSVEQLAGVSDERVPKLMGGMGGLELREKAKAFLAQRASAESIRAELDALRAQLAAMQSQPSTAKVTVIPAAAEAHVLGAPPAAQEVPTRIPADAPANTATRRRGRPPKAQAAAQ